MSGDERYASEAEALADALPPYANALPTGESTSAGLRRVEQERDQALAKRDQAIENGEAWARDANLLRAELASARIELTEQLDGTEKLLTQMERERDSERRERLATEADLRSARTELESWRGQSSTQRAEIERLERLLVSSRTELDAVRAARDNLDRARSWIVARDGGRACIRCDQEIRRGEAYELMPGADQLQHIHCPTEPKEHETA